jgi:hypothetical protein
MADFKEFNSLDEMFEYMEDQTVKANAGLAPAQCDLTWGSYFVNFQPADDLVIFGRVFTADEARENEIKAGASEAEADFSSATLADSLTRGYLFGRAYSVWEPGGELGSTHRASAWPISRELFEAAQAVKWVPGELDHESLVQLDAAWQAFRSHKIAQIQEEVERKT